MRTILREEIPVDDEVYTRVLSGPIVHVATRRHHFVEFWWLSDPEAESRARHFFVVGTGHPIERENAEHVGTAIGPGGQLVWHLMEVVK